MTKEKNGIYLIDINSTLFAEIRRLMKNTESSLKRCFSTETNKLDRD